MNTLNTFPANIKAGPERPEARRSKFANKAAQIAKIMQQPTFLANDTFLSFFFLRKEGILGIQRYSKIPGSIC
jgi:hypothetical protein